MNTPEDDAFEEDIAAIDRAVAVLRATLKEAGLWEGKHGEEGCIRVDAYARSGLPVEMDSSR